MAYNEHGREDKAPIYAFKSWWQGESMPLPEEIEGARWAKKISRVIFPWLIWCAKNHRTLFYSDLDAEIVRRGIHHHINFVMYGHPAGAVGDALLEIGEEFGEEIPPLNALVVARTGSEACMPSEGCDWYLEKLLDRKVASVSFVNEIEPT